MKGLFWIGDNHGNLCRLQQFLSFGFLLGKKHTSGLGASSCVGLDTDISLKEFGPNYSKHIEKFSWFLNNIQAILLFTLTCTLILLWSQL